jgi:NAD(P)H-dependent flavin oxidoreductase YrpB (nitropropane dioxygenase family)
MDLKSVTLAGREVLPLVEGGKGISVSNGLTCGAWARCGGMGTFSGVNPDYLENGKWVAPSVFRGKSRAERQKELVEYGVRGCLDQAAVAHETAGGAGAVAMNVMWEQGGSQELISRVLEKARGTIRAISCGAGMPFHLADICAANKVFYNPIVSSVRAFQLLWKRSFHRFKEFLGAVIYEDPWLAGGHNGLSNSEDPVKPEGPLARIKEIRKFMNEVGLKTVPIIVAGGIWWLSEWMEYIDNPEIGPVAFQFGTRPMVTVESPIHVNVKKRLMKVSKGEVLLQRFSPTGFYSSAVENDFMKGLEANLARQLPFKDAPDAALGFDVPVELASSGGTVYISAADREKFRGFVEGGFDKALKTPSGTLLFASKERYDEIGRDMRGCLGCLSACLFSGWDQRGTLGLKPDPRSFCIQRSLKEISHGNDPEGAFLFAGHVAYRFKDDPFYRGGEFIPTVKELVDRIKTGY